MPARQELAIFIRSHFRSVWSLELLLLLKREPVRTWTNAEIVDALRASQIVVSMSVELLLAGGMIVLESDDQVRFGPVDPDHARLIDEVETLYAKKPDAVRRLIVSSTNSGMAAFADAFKLRRE